MVFSLRNCFFCLAVSACTVLGSAPIEPILSNGTPLIQSGFKDVSGNDVLLKTYLREQPRLENTAANYQQQKIGFITIYIEGDGAAWIARQYAPKNPTPLHALSAQMAMQDPSPLVAYLGRPCQYLDLELLKQCDDNLWIAGRFSQQAISLGNQAIDALLEKLASSNLRSLKVKLVGYSGGGAYAALLASQRSDVVCLVTIAAPLDIDAWARLQKIAPLSSSLNPASPTARLPKIEQTHWHGAKDLVVPPESVGLYPIQNASATTKFAVLPLANHTEPWNNQWTSMMQASCLR